MSLFVASVHVCKCIIFPNFSMAISYDIQKLFLLKLFFFPICFCFCMFVCFLNSVFHIGGFPQVFGDPWGDTKSWFEAPSMGDWSFGVEIWYRVIRQGLDSCTVRLLAISLSKCDHFPQKDIFQPNTAYYTFLIKFFLISVDIFFTGGILYLYIL